MTYHFDQSAAERAVQFIERFITHVKAEKAGTPLLLEDWQKEIVRKLFGWKCEDGTRKFRTAYIEIPRKNAKSTLSAAIALYLLFSDGEMGAEIYSAGSDRGQAGIVFDIARRMVMGNKKLSEKGNVLQHAITFEEKGSTYKAVSADVKTKHGYNAHGIIFDELHAQPNRDLWDVLTTSTGSRRQPLTIAITTAGFDRQSICWEVHDYACKVRDGIIKDETFLPIIYAAGPDDDIYSEETWKKANPGYGTIVKKEYIQEKAEKARQQPTFENTFRRLHLNQWTTSEVKWIPDEKWMACKDEFPDFIGMECTGGLDLASTRDICALVLHFLKDEKHYFMPFFFIPTLSAKERTKKDGVNYDAWVRQGLMIETPGNVTDYDYIRKKVNELGQIYRIKSIAYDRANASQLIIDLSNKDGFTCTPFGQGFVSMSAPTKELERLVYQNAIVHDGNPVLRWMCSNVMIEIDAAGNIKINKGKSKEKVDGMVAAVMALGEYMTTGPTTSVYETRGVLIL